MKGAAYRICLIEDDAIMGEALGERLEMEGFRHDWYRAGRAALLGLQRKHYDAVVSDIRLPELSGEDVFLELRRERKEVPPFVFITAYGTIDHAVRLLKLGATDYVTKPLDVDALILKLTELCRVAHLPEQTDCVLGISGAMRRIESLLPRLAQSHGTVLITGDSGVGKEWVALRLHRLSDPEHQRPFIPVNCGAIPETLLEAELFGFEKGSFTGATRDKRGYFEQAHGGTLFLDEIGDMSAAMQVKLLRAIQERSIVRVGGEAPVRVDIRFVCATHQDLRQLVERGEFREDLYYRVNVIHLRVPPLRERREDILWLAKQFLDEQSARRAGAAFRLTPQAERALLGYAWPGNVRELRHCIERACIMSTQPLLDTAHLFSDTALLDLPAKATGDTLIQHLDACEKRYLEQMLHANDWRVGDSAASLGISRKTLWQKMRKHGISEPEKE